SIVQMIISEDPFFTGAVWEPYAPTKTWTLSAGFGSKTVYAKYRNASNVESNVFSATINYLAQCVQISLAPPTATNPIGTTHTVTATVTDSSNAPQSGVSVAFSVLLGPNTGASGVCSVNVSCSTDLSGQVSFTYTGSGGVGTDTIRACFMNQAGGQTCSNTVTKDWTSASTTSTTSTISSTTITSTTITSTTT